MKIDILPLGHIGANCYMLLTEKAAVVIDAGLYSEDVEKFLTDNSDKERIILITHAHFDHIIGGKQLRDNTGVKIGIGENDAIGLFDTSVSLSDKFHAHQEPYHADILFKDGEEFKIGDLNIKVIETPGHTPGGVCYLIGDCLFSGDTLFLEAVGRTDMYGADYDTLMNSCDKLITLDENIRVYPGHGDSTTIGHEKKYNPFIRGKI